MDEIYFAVWYSNPPTICGTKVTSNTWQEYRSTFYEAKQLALHYSKYYEQVKIKHYKNNTELWTVNIK